MTANRADPSAPSPIWPQPADLGAAALLVENYAALGSAAARFAKSGPGGQMLAGIGGNAPYLADLMCKHPDIPRAFVRRGADAILAAIMDELSAGGPGESRPKIAQALRRAKARASLIIALADIGGIWQLEQVTAALSDLAEAALGLTIDHLLADLDRRGEIELPDPLRPGRQSGFTVLALGKLGARELNYSSDIDLVLLYDPGCPVYSNPAQAAMQRLAHDIVALLAQRDADGYVFRVDLRLRPDAGATPPVVALPAALAYYESQGRTWERAAFSKARPVAGDLALGQAFLNAIRPFIWRRHLDFAAISEIHDMKRRIDQERGQNGSGSDPVGKWLDFDVKLGKGGIREIEFIVQTLGLVWGGHDTTLRIPATLSSLPALARAQHLPEEAAQELAACYRRLRQIEHRLQMVHDRQTHQLPASRERFGAFAVFMGSMSAASLAGELAALTALVHQHFLLFFDAGAPDIGLFDPGEAGRPPEAFANRLSLLGFRDIGHLTTRLRAWKSGDIPALRSPRARELLNAVLPGLLGALAHQPDPDRAFGHFDNLLARQRAGVQLLSLFQRNPALLSRLAAVMGAAPPLAEYLARNPAALEAILAPQPHFHAPGPALRNLLAEAADMQDVLAVVRGFVRREEFSLSVATLENRLDADHTGRLRSALAQAALQALLPRVLAEHKARYGLIKSGRFGVLALGRAGAGEMLAGSDLDLMLLYDHAETEGGKIAPAQYFLRLANALVAALTAPGVEGPIYAVDMRLRPSGNKGPVAVSLASFRHYHAHDSWTWERMALTRGRVMAATRGFAPELESALLGALMRGGDAARQLANANLMRARLARDAPPRGPFDVKHLPGGSMETSFIAAILLIIHGTAHPELFRPTTRDALAALAEAGLLSKEEAKGLIHADHLWRSIQGIARITGLADDAAAPPEASLDALLRATGTLDLAQLHATMKAASSHVRACFIRHVGNPEEINP